jgi:hypothetical protein
MESCNVAEGDGLAAVEDFVVDLLDEFRVAAF